MLPNFIGIGAPKAGTTWFFRCLNDHPEVFMAPIKETNFFDYANIEGRLNEYERHFMGADKFLAIGEISTRYLTSKYAPERIKNIIPQVRLFVSLRNPIDQIYSHYWHLLRQNFHQWDRSKVPHSFEEALERYPERLLEPAYYYKHLKRWLSYFDRTQLLIIFFDDIRNKPFNVLKSLYKFIGVNHKYMPPSLTERGKSVRRGVSPKSSLLWNIHSIIHNQLSRRVYYPLKRLMGIYNANRIKELLKVREIMEHIFMQQGYPKMNPKTRTFLRNHFATEIENLSILTGRDLSHWQ